MTAVLTVRVGRSVVGSCGRACYDAGNDPCHCICEGMNHGAGEADAIANTREHSAAWVKRARADGWDIDTYELGLPVTQPALF